MSKANDIKVKELKPVFTPEQIAARIQELAAEINAEYGDEPMVAVCVLKGGFMFFSDLVRFLHNKNLELDFVRLSSYGKGSSSSKHGGFVPAQLEEFLPLELRPHQIDAALDFILPDLRHPLEGREGLGHKGRKRSRHL